EGVHAMLMFLPHEKIGVVVLTNLDARHNSVPAALGYHVFDRLLGVEPADWSARLREGYLKDRRAEEEATEKGFSARKEGTHPSHDIAESAGEYEHPAYGVVHIEAKGADLLVTHNRTTRALRHFHFDTFEVAPDPIDLLEKLKVTFLTNVNGDIDAL